MSEKKKAWKTTISDIKQVGKEKPSSSKASKDGAHSGKKTWQVALSNQIIANSKPSQTVPETDWLDSLKEDSASFLQGQIGSQRARLKKETSDKESIEVTVEKLFCCLQGFMYDFNKVAGGTDLHVSGTISGDVTEIISYNKFREAEQTRTYFRARFSTRFYSLLIRGSNGKIDFFLLPVSRAMALSTIESEYSPLATIEVCIDEDEGILWRPMDIEAKCRSLDDLCVWLFKQLIDKTKAAMAGETH